MKRGENGLTDQDVQSCRQNLEKTPMAEFEKRVDRQKMTTDNKSTINMRLFFIIISFVSEMKVKQRAKRKKREYVRFSFSVSVWNARK